MVEIVLVMMGALIGLVIGGLCNAADHHRQQHEYLELYDERQELLQALEEQTQQVEALGSDYAELAGDEIHLKHLLNRLYERYLNMGSPRLLYGLMEEARKCGYVERPDRRS